MENAKKELDKGAIVILAGDLNEPSHLDWVESTKDMRRKCKVAKTKDTACCGVGKESV